MPHVRQTIREAIVTALTGLTTTGSNVFDSRVYPINTLPSLAIYFVTDSVNDEATSGRIQVREGQVVVEGRVRANTGLEDTIDTICAEVEAALYDAVHVQTTGALSLRTGNVEDAEYVGCVIDYHDEQEQPLGVVLMTFRFNYRVDPADPTTAVT